MSRAILARSASAAAWVSASRARRAAARPSRVKVAARLMHSTALLSSGLSAGSVSADSSPSAACRLTDTAASE